jgi:hypothetical protein
VGNSPTTRRYGSRQELLDLVSGPFDARITTAFTDLWQRITP